MEPWNFVELVYSSEATDKRIITLSDSSFKNIITIARYNYN
jgi:hypothetical protein